MRSSKREIVLGLSIGVGLSLVLAGLGQSYVDDQRSWQAQGGLETAKLSALPQPAASLPAASLPAASSPGLDITEARALAPSAAQGSLEPAEPRAMALPASRAIEQQPAPEAKREARAPEQRGARHKSGQVAKRATPRRIQARGSDGAPVPVKTSLSPSESAGLGLDLPL